MKKTGLSHALRDRRALHKTMLLMKLSLAIILIASLHVSGRTFSQDTISVRFNELKLDKALHEVEKKSSYRFVYSSLKLPRDAKVSLTFSGIAVRDLLARMLENTGLTYKVMANNLVVISKQETSTQGLPVKGKVTDGKGDPMVNVSVTVKGKNGVGVTTNQSGEFSINAEPGDILIFSSIGFESQSVKVGDRSTINISLVQADSKLNDVVVTALGIKREKKTIGYSITSLKGDDLMKAGNTVNPLTTLYGQAAGVGITVGSAGPTGSVNIKIRGSAGLDASTKTRPLIVVDGVPIYDENSNMATRGYDPLNSFDYGTGINDINGEDIESIEILKGAKASVLYGSRAGNGVILITSKKGQKTRGLGVGLTFQSTLDHPVSYIDWQNEYGSGQNVYDTVYGKDRSGNTVRVMNNSRLQFGPKFDGSRIMGYDSSMTTYRAYPDNWNRLFRNTVTNITTVSMSGANERGNMRLSYTRKDYLGEVNNFFQKDNTLSFHGQINASDLATFEINSNLYSIKTQNRYPNVARLVSYGFNRDIDYQGIAHLYKDSLGQAYNTQNNSLGFPTSVAGDGSGYFASLWNQNENRNIDNKTHFTGSIKVNLKFTPSISLTGNAGVDYTDWDFTNYSKVTQIVPTVMGGKYSFERKNYNVQNFNAFLNYNHSFHHDWDIFAFAGPEYSKTTYTDLHVNTVGGLQFANWYDLSASQTTTGDYGQTRGAGRNSSELHSVLGSASIGYKGTYYLELSARNDWTSLLQPGYNSYFYPGASATWNFSQNLQIPKLTYGKLRLSWANVGRGAPYPYFASPSYGLGVVPGTTAVTVSGPSALFSGVIKPERNREMELGFDTRWFETTPLEVDFSYYTGNTYDQIMGLNLSQPTGFTNIRFNAGNVKKWGYELFIKYTPAKTNSLRWDVTFNAANQRTKVIKLYPGITNYAIAGSGAYVIRAVEGKPIGDIQLYDYLRDLKGNKIVAGGVYGPDNKKFVTAGNVNPDFIGGFGTDFYYKSFNIHAGFDYKFGGRYLSYSNFYLIGNGQVKSTLKYRDQAHGGLAYYIDGSGNNVALTNGTPPAGTKIYYDGVILPGVVANMNGTYSNNTTIISAATYYGQYIHDLSEWFQPDNLVKNNYIKFRELSLTYTIPKSIVSKVKLQKAAVSAIARNLFYLYKTIPNIDPESLLGSDQFVEYSPYPQMRSYGVKLDVSF